MVHFALSSASFTQDPYLKSHNCTDRTPFFPWCGFWESENRWSMLVDIGASSSSSHLTQIFLLDVCQILKNRFHVALSPRDRMGLNGIDSPILSSESRNGRPEMHDYAQREVVEFNTLFEKWINAEVPRSRFKDLESWAEVTTTSCPN